MGTGSGPTSGKPCSSPDSAICIRASLPVNGIPPLSWSISSCRTGRLPRESPRPIGIVFWMSATSSFEVCDLPGARTTCVAPASKTDNTVGVIRCDVDHQEFSVAPV